MFLAEGVAAVTTATGGLDAWLSPQGITAGLATLTTLLGVLATLAKAAGKNALAAQLAGARETVADSQEQAQTTAALLRTVIQGVEAAKNAESLSPEAKQILLTAIQDVSKKAGMESTLKPVVEAVTKQGVEVPALLQTLSGVLEKLQAARPAPAPPAA